MLFPPEMQGVNPNPSHAGEDVALTLTLKQL